MSNPLYMNIARQILTEILVNQVKPGQKISSVREYALAYKVNAKTIQRAFDYLDQKQIFYSIVGEGRYLSSDEEVIDLIKNELIFEEAKQFVIKMQTYQLSLEDVTQIIKENYERDI